MRVYTLKMKYRSRLESEKASDINYAWDIVDREQGFRVRMNSIIETSLAGEPIYEGVADDEVKFTTDTLYTHPRDFENFLEKLTDEQFCKLN